MNAKRNSVLMAFIVLFFFPLSVYSQNDCQNVRQVMESAISIRDRDIDLGTEEKKEPYIKELEDVLESLNSCKKNIKDPFTNLEIDTLINSINGRIKQVGDLDPYENKNCQKCKDIEECIKLCNEYRKKKEWWRKEYVETIQGHDKLDCMKCLEHLEKYYSTIEYLLSRKEPDPNQTYSKESITAMWGILYSISQDEKCLGEAQEKLRYVMLPFMMPPSELLRKLIEKLGGLTPGEQEKLLWRNEDALKIMDIFIEVLRRTDPDSLAGWNVGPPVLAQLLSNMVAINPDNVKETLRLLSAQDLVSVFAAILKSFKELMTPGERRKVVGRKDTLEIVNLFIDFWRKTDPGVLKGINLQATELADKLAIIIKHHPEELKNLSEENIGLLYSILREITPGEPLPPSPSPRPPLKYKYLTSFLMPGYVRSYHEQEPSRIVKAWNYSNIGLLGLAVVSEAAYINTDYDNDALFHIGVTAAVAFVVNGVLGIVDAARYDHPKNNKDSTAITGPYISINGQYDELALMFTFKF